MDQAFINNVLKNYSRLQDFHNNPPYPGPFVHIANFVATAINATLVSTRSLKQTCSTRTLKKIPTFYNVKFAPVLSHLFNQIQNVHGKIEKPSAIQRVGLECNFLSCSQPKVQLEDISPLQMFRKTAEPTVWICLVLSLIFVSVTINFSLRKNFLSTIFISLSALLSPGVYRSQRFQHSCLLTLWMYTSVVLATYYSGSLASALIKPMKEYSIEKVAELVGNNYSMISEDREALFIVKTLANLSDFSEEAKMLKSLITKARIVSDDNELSRMMTRLTERYSLVSLWTNVLRGHSRAAEFIEKNKILNVRCFLGKELFFHQNVFFVLSPPNSDYLAEITGRMMEAGYFGLWWNELIGMGTSTRVQDRRKMLSRTKIEDEKNEPKALKLWEGKFKNSFVLWMTCLSMCLLCFCIEKLISL